MFKETLVSPFCILEHTWISPIPSSLSCPVGNILFLRNDLSCMMNENKKILHPYKKDEEFEVPPLLAYKKLTQVREVDVLPGIFYYRKKMKSVKAYCLHPINNAMVIKRQVSV